MILLLIFFLTHGFLSQGSPLNTATNVYGQGDSFVTSSAGTSSSTFFFPTGVAFDSTGKMYISDRANNRVLIYPSINANAATLVIGQTNLVSGTFTSCTSTTFGDVMGIAIDNLDNLYVADQSCLRVLVFPSGQTTASFVIGQTIFTSKTSSTCGNLQFTPQYIYIDQSNNDLYVTDIGGNRVMVFAFQTTTAKMIYGICSSITTVLNPPNASSLNVPGAIVLDANKNVYISDSNNNRVVGFPAGQSVATLLYGPSSFNVRQNTIIESPYALAFENGNLFISCGPGTILAFSQSSTTPTATYGTNNGVSATSFFSVSQILSHSNQLFVVDETNNRVLSFPPAQIQQAYSQSTTCSISSTSWFVTFPTTCIPSAVCTNNGGLFGSITVCEQFVPTPTWGYVSGWSASTTCTGNPTAVISAPNNQCSGYWIQSTYSLNCNAQTITSCGGSNATCFGCGVTSASASGSCTIGTPTPSFSLESYEWVCTPSATTTNGATTTSNNKTTAPGTSSMIAVTVFVLVILMFI